MNKEKNFISAVVYVRNNEKIIKDFALKLNKVLENKFLKYEIIFVNDESIDNSLNEIKEFAKNVNNATVSVINMSYYQGLELSMNAGVDLAIGDFVYEFDSVYIDYNLDLIFETYLKSLEGYDIVNTSSKGKRKKSSTLFYKLFNKFSNYQYKIDTETFRIVSRRAINRMNAMNKTIPYRKAIQANCGLKITSIYYKQTKTNKLKIDKQLKRERGKNAFDALILFTDVSYKATIILTMIMFLFSIFVSIYTLVTFFTKQTVEGWASTMLFMSFGFTGVFLIYAIIIKYLSLILNLIFKKTNYLIESIDKLN